MKFSSSNSNPFCKFCGLKMQQKYYLNTTKSGAKLLQEVAYIHQKK